jgi:lysozyme
MRPRLQVSRSAIDLVKRFEGYRRKAAQLPDGRWTVGYGHTLSAREGAEVSEADAEALLIYDLMGVARSVTEQVYAPLNQNQFDALVAFAFSVGPEAFRGSEVLKRVNEGAFLQAAYALELWRRAEFEGESLVIDALVRRRAVEKLLFLTPPGGAWLATPSAVLKPQLDRQMRDAAPASEPAELVALLNGEAVEVTRTSDAESSAAAAEAAGAPPEVLFAEPEAAPETAEPPSSAADGEDAMPRILIRDPAAFDEAPPREADFSAPPIQPREPRSAALSIAALLVVGLAFFAGGIFWALNATPGPQPGIFTPLLVGWLAGVAGVGFLASGAFMLLQRLGGATERRHRRRR